jgi:DNA-directed RNA polymerase specialized sigma24 family protein
VLTAWKGLGSFDKDRGCFSTWVGTIARNKCFDSFRGKGAKSGISNYDWNDDDLSINEAPSEDFSLDALLREYRIELKSSEVALLEMLGRGMTYAQISAVQQMPMGTVKSSLHRIRSYFFDTREETKGSQKRGKKFSNDFREQAIAMAESLGSAKKASEKLGILTGTLESWMYRKKRLTRSSK